MLIVLYLLAAAGALSLCIGTYRLIMRDSAHCSVIAEVADSEKVEGVIRSLMRQNPDAQIYIVNRCIDGEGAKIIEKLCNDYPCVHICESVVLSEL